MTAVWRLRILSHDAVVFWLEMVDVKIVYCYPEKKRHVVHVTDCIIYKDDYYLFFTVTYYGAGKVEYGVNYLHKDAPPSIKSSIPLTKEEMEHIIFEEKGRCGDIEVERTIKHGSDIVMLNRFKKDEVMCSVPMTPSLFDKLQARCIDAVYDFELMGPYTDTRNGDITVTDRRAQRILTLVYLRVSYYNKSKIEDNEDDRNWNVDLALRLVQDVKLADVNRFLKPAGVVRQCDEPLRSVFDDEVEDSYLVLDKTLPYSAHYFKHVAECRSNLVKRW